MAEGFYLCIDLKSFFASVDAVDSGLDPFTTNLVVADLLRGRGDGLSGDNTGDEGAENKKTGPKPPEILKLLLHRKYSLLYKRLLLKSSVE